MKNLIIVRHGKSSWDTAFEDINRPLSSRGVKDAHLVSTNIANYLPKTFIIWSSPAKRAAETALIFSQNLSCPAESIIVKDELYTFDEKELERTIKNCNNEFDSVILFGHNEAITNFVNKFGDVTINNVPTSGFVSIGFEESDWQHIKKGKTQKVIFPRDLKI
ncbi:SixA phosphatase family protein [Flavobacterium sp. '19STA2R22 D10 B1']|uniref:SixA phosphatase family protein n=1 Tax=Flavobacterium aerium TaxID=3037261 RepID=UPI00278C87C2|nr:histidine phosphatase family protein [Flavobacterium sp. '19STA2R22 D10 B1']